MADSSSVWMEEDNWCMREVLPLAASSWCQSEMVQGEEFASKHRIESELGPIYSDMYVRGDCPAPLSSLGITRQEFDELMRSCGFRQAAVKARIVPGRIAGYREDVAGCDYRSVVFIDWDESDVIENISVDGPIGPEETDLMGALRQLGRRYPLLYVDWPWKLLAAIDDGPGLDEVASRLEEVRRENRKRYRPRRWWAFWRR